MWDEILRMANEKSVIEESLTIHYNKFNAQGLRVIGSFFKRQGFPVSEIIPEDKLVKKSGVPTKKVRFVFEAGQVLELFIAFKLSEEQQKLKGAKLTEALTKSLGTVFKAKVNGGDVPVQMPKTSGPVSMKSLKQIVKALGQVKITKAERGKMVAATQAAEKRAAPRKPTSASARLNIAEARLEELQAALKAARKELDKENKTKEKLTKQKGELQTELDGLLTGNEALTQQLQEIQARGAAQ